MKTRTPPRSHWFMSWIIALISSRMRASCLWTLSAVSNLQANERKKEDGRMRVGRQRGGGRRTQLDAGNPHSVALLVGVPRLVHFFVCGQRALQLRQQLCKWAPGNGSF